MEKSNKTEYEVIPSKVMNNIGLAYIVLSTRINKGYINPYCKLCIRDVYRNVNQFFRFSVRVTLNRTRL